mmetsp:Transcript_20521/g.31361  ORF Transcript_20521/g.31361 Transcript_20521/m.31361 type:complete len:91 (-) Transcript_20521:253-525(-)
MEANETKRCVVHDPRSGEARSRNSNTFANDMNLTSLDTTNKLSINCVRNHSKHGTISKQLYLRFGRFIPFIKMLMAVFRTHQVKGKTGCD